MGVHTRLFIEMVQVVPAILILTVLPTVFGENKQDIEFGARVEQAKPLCTNRRTCRFGYTFGVERERDLSISESKHLEADTVTNQRLRNEENSRKRAPRLRIDPRRRKNNISENSKQDENTENPVTIRIGGVPIVIPDFDLSPSPDTFFFFCKGNFFQFQIERPSCPIR